MHKFNIKDKKQFVFTLAVILSMVLAIILLIIPMQDKTVKNSHTSNAKSASKEGIIITEHKLGINLVLPSDWDGLYTREDRNNSISFYYSKAYEKTKKGLIFTIYVDKTSNIDSENGPYSKLMDFHKLKTKDDMSLCVAYPTSNKYNEDIKKKLDSMTEDVKNVIINTINFNE